MSNRPVVNGNNKFGQSGTLRCQQCRKRHRQVIICQSICLFLRFECVFSDTSRPCQYCSDNGLPCGESDKIPGPKHRSIDPEASQQEAQDDILRFPNPLPQADQSFLPCDGNIINIESTGMFTDPDFWSELPMWRQVFLPNFDWILKQNQITRETPTRPFERASNIAVITITQVVHLSPCVSQQKTWRPNSKQAHTCVRNAMLSSFLSIATWIPLQHQRLFLICYLVQP